MRQIEQTTMRRLLAAISFSCLPVVAAAAPLFDAHLEAKQNGDEIDVAAVIANRSGHPACYPVIPPDLTWHYRDGNRSTLVSTNEPSWQFGRPAFFPIQIVPADRKPRAYFLWSEHSAARSADAVSVDATIELFDCKAFLKDRAGAAKKVFEAPLTAPVSR
jgi:hypothetical protein